MSKRNVLVVYGFSRTPSAFSSGAQAAGCLSVMSAGSPISTTCIVRPDLYHFLHLNFSGLQGRWGLREPTLSEGEGRRVSIQHPPHQGLGFGGGRGLCFNKTPFPCAAAPASSSSRERTGCCAGQARSPGSRGAAGAHLSQPLGSEEWAKCCEHSQAGVWLPILRGISDQPLSLPPGSL